LIDGVEAQSCLDLHRVTELKDLESAMEMAYAVAKTDKVIIFDGNFGHINCSPSMAQLLMEKAPEVSRKVDEALLPMWLKQRGINPSKAI